MILIWRGDPPFPFRLFCPFQPAGWWVAQSLCVFEFAASRIVGKPNHLCLSHNVRPMRVLSWFTQDLRYGLRGLCKDVGFAMLAVLALALGIGASAVIFSVIDNVLLEPFPYRAPERLTKFYVHDPAHPEQPGRVEFSMPEYTAFKEQNHVFEDIIATTGFGISAGQSCWTSRLWGLLSLYQRPR